MKTKVIQDDNQDKVWQSAVLNNGDFNYRLYVHARNLEEYTGEDLGWSVDVYAAKTVDELSSEQLADIASCFGFEQGPQQITDYDVIDYGLSARLDSFKGEAPQSYTAMNRAGRDMVKQFPVYESLFGFYMDKQQNRVGNNGWDFINGRIGFQFVGQE